MSATTRYLLIAVLVLLLIVGGSFAIGFRLFVIAPRPGIPDGFVAIVHGGHELHPVDSPAAMCERWDSAPDTECVTRAITQVNHTGRVLVRIPYFSLLAVVAGVPSHLR